MFTFPRGYGTAVERNYSRRISRESYRLIKGHLAGGFDFSVFVFPGKDDFSVRKDQLISLFKKAGLWSDGQE